MAKRNQETEENKPIEVVEETTEIKETKEEKQDTNVIHIDDYLNFYSDLHPVSKTSMRMAVIARTFRTIEEWQEMEKQYQ